MSDLCVVNEVPSIPILLGESCVGVLPLTMLIGMVQFKLLYGIPYKMLLNLGSS